MADKIIETQEYYTTAISLGDMKNGMLYFDRIIPVALSVEFANDYSDDGWGDILKKVSEEVLPKDLLVNRDFGRRLYLLNISGYKFMSKILIKQFNFPEEIEGVSKKQYETIEQDFANEYLSFVHDFGFSDYPLLSLGDPRTASFPENTDTPISPLLTLSNLKIIDASDAPWEQILEFRKDVTAKAKLRKLRLFAYENYSGKSRNYIEDDIHSKIYDYKNIAKKFGFETVQATLSNVISSKLFVSVTTGSILTTIFSDHPIGLITTSVGALIEFGQLALELKKQKYELQNLLKDNPASFITYYRDKHGEP